MNENGLMIFHYPESSFFKSWPHFSSSRLSFSCVWCSGNIYQSERYQEIFWRPGKDPKMLWDLHEIWVISTRDMSHIIWPRNYYMLWRSEKVFKLNKFRKYLSGRPKYCLIPSQNCIVQFVDFWGATNVFLFRPSCLRPWKKTYSNIIKF